MHMHEGSLTLTDENHMDWKWQGYMDGKPDEGHTVLLAENAAQARAARRASAPDLVLLDIWMPDTDGVSLLKEWAAILAAALETHNEI